MFEGRGGFLRPGVREVGRIRERGFGMVGVFLEQHLPKSSGGAEEIRNSMKALHVVGARPNLSGGAGE